MKDEYYVDEDFENDGEPETIEVASDVPRDFRFVHVSTGEGELMKLIDDDEEEQVTGPYNLIETMSAERDVPLNFGFVHLQNQDGDDIMRYM